jgi:hypothetical protein
MGAYNKAAAAALTGAALYVFSALLKYFAPDFHAAVWTGEMQAAINTLVTAAIVYYVPNNTPPSNPNGV